MRAGELESTPESRVDESNGQTKTVAMGNGDGQGGN